MTTTDIINGIFESFSSVICWLNVVKLVKDKEVRGISWLAQVFLLRGELGIFIITHQSVNGHRSSAEHFLPSQM